MKNPLVEQQKPKSKLVRNIIIAIVVIIIIALIIGGLVYLKSEYKFEIKPNSNKLNIELCEVNQTIFTNNIMRILSIDELNSISCNANNTIIKTIELVPGKYTSTQLKEHLRNQLNNMQLGIWEVYVDDKVDMIETIKYDKGAISPSYKFKLKSIDSDAYDALGIKDHINKMSVVSEGDAGRLRSYINFV